MNDDLPRVRKEEFPLRSQDAHSLLKGFCGKFRDSVLGFLVCVVWVVGLRVEG